MNLKQLVAYLNALSSIDKQDVCELIMALETENSKEDLEGTEIALAEIFDSYKGIIWPLNAN